MQDSSSAHTFFTNAIFHELKVARHEGVQGGKTSRVLLIYTGGTIGMKQSDQGYIPVRNFLKSTLSTMSQFHCGDPISPDDEAQHKKQLITPLSIYGKRIKYDILEFDPPLDSSNMSMDDWAKIAKTIEENYNKFDGFVILHGTDTMAFTASALSFMLENLGKTVIITGSQVPIIEQRNDARENLLGALTIAGHFIIPEVGLFFNNKLLRGNRAAKADASSYDAFASANLRPLATVGISISVDWDLIKLHDSDKPFAVSTTMSSKVGILSLFPGITDKTVAGFLSKSNDMSGVVLLTYGAGNAPDSRKELMQILKEAADRGTVILNITQCQRGFVTDAYAAGRVLKESGVTPGSDMTYEAGLTKLSYLLGKGYTTEEIREKLCQDLRGELSKPQERFSFEDNTFVKAVANVLQVDTAHDFKSIAKALHPVLMCSFAAQGDLESIESMVEKENADVNGSDYDRRTPLHTAAISGKDKVVDFLIKKSAKVHVSDVHGHSPLWDAAIEGHNSVCKTLRDAGASLVDCKQLHSRLITAVAKGDLPLVQRLIENRVDANALDYDGRTSLHVAISREQKECVEYLLKVEGIDTDVKDSWGKTPRDYAKDKELEHLFG